MSYELMSYEAIYFWFLIVIHTHKEQKTIRWKKKC